MFESFIVYMNAMEKYINSSYIKCRGTGWIYRNSGQSNRALDNSSNYTAQKSLEVEVRGLVFGRWKPWVRIPIFYQGAMVVSSSRKRWDR